MTTAMPPRRQEILTMLCDGKSTAEICGTLYIGVETAKTHTRKLREHFGVHNTTAVVAEAYKQGYAKPASPNRENPNHIDDLAALLYERVRIGGGRFWQNASVNVRTYYRRLAFDFIEAYHAPQEEAA